MSSSQRHWLDQVGGVLETLNQGVIITDEARRVVFANSMFLEMIKMSAGELLGRSIVDLYPPEDAINLLEFIGRREAQGRARYEFYIPQADGGRLPVAVTSRHARTTDGQSFGIVTATDISDQKRLQAELSQANALLLGRQRQVEQDLQLAERIQPCTQKHYLGRGICRGPLPAGLVGAWPGECTSFVAPHGAAERFCRECLSNRYGRQRSLGGARRQALPFEAETTALRNRCGSREVVGRPRVQCKRSPAER